MAIRVLIVEDYEFWRCYVSSVLQTNPQYQVIGAVADGLEAVQMAERLKPDLVMLDIGLPTLNGIEAARRIRALSPESRILFLSEQRSPDVVEAALGTGANAYVLKSDAGDELLPALEAVLEGKQFISARMVRHGAARNKSLPLP